MRALKTVRWLRFCMALGCLTGALWAAAPSVAQEAAQAAAEVAAPAPETASAGDATATEPPEEPPAAPLTLDEVAYAVDNMILFFCAVLVLFMQSGFAMVETGFNASKNAVNILFKNTIDMCIGIVLFYLVGFGLMYPGEEYNGGWFGFGGVGISSEMPTPGPGTLNPYIDWLFQVAFAATAATIVSGAVAGRMRFISYLIYTAVITAFVYPISGMWKWGGGYLDKVVGFHDFAGSIVVHAVGGFAALAGAIMLGARRGRFTPDGKSVAMPGHNLSIATLGVFILLVGWYGFNPGSSLAFANAANTNATALIAVNTTIAAGLGGLVAMIVSWMAFKKPDLSMSLNGILAGLVGITANCDCVTNNQAIIIGGVAGALVVAAIVALDKLCIDDPVGAFPVHGVCGVWGGLATGIFGHEKDLLAQVKGIVVICSWSFITMLILFAILNAIGILRVSPEDEEKGLDLSEHGMEAYHHG